MKHRYAILSLILLLSALALPAMAQAEGLGDDTPLTSKVNSSRLNARRHRELRADQGDVQSCGRDQRPMPPLEGRRALVTGASGFIGTNLSERLLEAGADVHAVARTPRRGGDGAQWWAADLSEREGAAALFRLVKPELVFHLASHVSGSRSLDAIVPTLNANLLSTVNVLLAAAEGDAQRVVLAGSLEEPDFFAGPAKPVSAYAASKYAAAAYGRMFHELHGVPVTILRIGMGYGPRQRDRTKLVPHVITSFLRNEAPFIGSGARMADWVYVDDMVDALLLSATREDAVGETIEVGCGVLTSVRDVVELIARLMQPSVRPRYGALPDRPNERLRKADLRRTHELLGWTPGTTLEAGLAATIASYGSLGAKPLSVQAAAGRRSA